MDYFIAILLITIIIYLIVRDTIVKKRRKKTQLLIKRLGRKLDLLVISSKKQSKSFDALLNILSRREDEED